MHRTTRLVALCAAATASGCFRAQDLFPMGLVVTGDETQNVETRTFFSIEDIGQIEGNDLLTSYTDDNNCLDVLQTGVTVTNSVVEIAHRYESFGYANTINSNGFRQGDPGLPIHILSEQMRQMSEITTDTVTFDYDPSDNFSFEENFSFFVEPSVENTFAEFVGYSGDEYVVRQGPPDHWNDAGPDSVPSPTFGRPGGFFGFDPNAPRVVTKLFPSMGEAWTSFDGMTVYKYVQDEVITLSGDGRDVTAQRVDVYRILGVGEADPDVDGLLDLCVIEKQAEETRPDPDDPTDEFQFQYRQVFLDESCATGFQAKVVGTIWFYRGIAVRWQQSVIEFAPNDALGEAGGYLVLIDVGDTCTLRVQSDDELSDSEQDDALIKRFFAYTRTETTTEYQVSSVAIANAEGEASPW